MIVASRLASAARAIHTPGIYVDRIIQGPGYEKRIEFRTVAGTGAKKDSPERTAMAKRAAENAGITAAAPATGSGFGLGGQKAPSEADLAELNSLLETR